MIHIFFFLLTTLSAQTMNPEETNYYYSETVPKHQLKMEFDFPQCHKSETLIIDRRNSLSEISGKKVRYVFLKGSLTGTPKTCKGKLQTTSLEYEVEPHKDLMTHVFIVMDREVKMKKIGSLRTL